MRSGIAKHRIGKMLRLTPVAGVGWTEHEFDWAPSDATFEWVELDANVSNADIARVVAALASYNSVASSGSLEATVRALERADCLILPGGLMIHTDALEIPPSCCCGLESWREWYAVAPEGSSPWLGHSPSPRVECREDRAVIWADSERGNQSSNVSVAYSDIDDALRSTHVALVAFTERLANWLSTHSPRGASLSRCFAIAFNVSA